MCWPQRRQGGQFSVDGESKDCVDWFLATVYQPHYDHFGAEFGRTIRGFFYDEPETRGDWGTELRSVFDERKVDLKKAFVAYKFELAGDGVRQERPNRRSDPPIPKAFASNRPLSSRSSRSPRLCRVWAASRTRPSTWKNSCALAPA